MVLLQFLLKTLNEQKAYFSYRRHFTKSFLSLTGMLLINLRSFSVASPHGDGPIHALFGVVLRVLLTPCWASLIAVFPFIRTCLTPFICSFACVCCKQQSHNFSQILNFVDIVPPSRAITQTI